MQPLRSACTKGQRYGCSHSMPVLCCALHSFSELQKTHQLRYLLKSMNAQFTSANLLPLNFSLEISYPETYEILDIQLHFYGVQIERDVVEGIP